MENTEESVKYVSLIVSCHWIKVFHCKQLNTFDHPYHIHKYLESEPLTFLLVNRYIVFNKFDKRIQLHMIMIYTCALPGQKPLA